jgi:hypothetical protein
MQMKDISQVFLYHLQWKTRLRDFIDGTGDFDITEISPEGCDLGKWLSSGEIKQRVSDAHIEELVSAHNELHDTAKRIYDLKIMGQSNAAREEFSNIVKSSMTIYSLLNALNIITDNQSVILSSPL